MACKYIFNNNTYSSKEEFIKEVLEKDFLNQPKTLRVQELQQPDFLKFIRKDKNYLKSQGLNEEEINFLNLLFGEDEKWTSFFIKSLIQNAAKEGYSKVWLPSGNTSAKVEGHTTLEEFKKQKEDRIKDLEKQLEKPEYVVDWLDTSGYSGQNTVFKTEQEALDYVKTENAKLPEDVEGGYTSLFNGERLNREIKQLKQELKSVEQEGFGALKPIYNFYENTVTNILNKTYGKDNVKVITDEYGNTWNEITITPKMSETIRLNTPNGKVKYTGDLAIEEKIAEEAENSKDEIVAKTPLQKFIQSIKNLLRNIFKERDKISRLLRDMNQGRLNSNYKNNTNQDIKYQLSKEQLDAIDNVFDENPELANSVYSKILTNSGLSAKNLLSLLLKENLIEKQCS